MLNKHSQIVENVALLLISSFHGSMEQLIPEIKENHIKDDLPKLYTLINDLLPFLHKHHKVETVEKLLVNSNLIVDLLTHADTNRFSDNLLKSAAISLLAEIWSLEPLVISKNEKQLESGSSVIDECLKVFKNTCKFSSRALKLQTIGLMFKLLDQFALSRDPQAPVIYKLLTFALIENVEDMDIREFMMVSFASIFQAHKTIPVSILAEPLLRLMQLNDERYKLNTADYTFFKMLANHPKLQSQPLGLLMIDQMAKLILQEQVWASAAKVPFLILAERFKNQQAIQDFLIKFATLCVTSVLQLKKQPPPNMQQQPTPKSQSTQKQKKTPNQSALQAQTAYQQSEIYRKIKLATVITLTEKILHLKAPLLSDQTQLNLTVNDQLKEVVLSTNRTYFKEYSVHSKGLLHLLEFWHQFDALQVQEKYNEEKDEEEKPKIDEELIMTLQKKNSLHINEEEGGKVIIKDEEILQTEIDIHNLDYSDLNNNEEEYFRILPSETRNSEISSRARHNINNQSQISGQNRRESSINGSATRQVVPYNPSNQVQVQQSKPPIIKRVNILAQQKIEAIKNQRNEKALKQQQDEEKRRIQHERNIQKAKEELQKRKITLGISKGSQQNDGQLVLYEAQTPKEEELGIQNKRHSMPAQTKQQSEPLKLIDWENDEEERDRDGVKIILAKYNKVFRFLFNKYALSGSQHQKIEKFEYYNEKQISTAEIQKFLRDHDLLASLVQTSILNQVVTNHDQSSALCKISKENVSTLHRLINLKNFRRQDLSPLSFPHFLELIPQIAFVLYSKTSPHLSMPEMLMKLLQHNERATKLKGQSTILYEDPDITTIGDQEMIKEMNRRVRENPDFILPEGYYKVQEKEQFFKYELPDYLNIKESKKVAIEVLDQIILEQFGFHILEALITYESRFKVKPRIKHGGSSASKQSESALSYMKPIEKKPFKQRDLSGAKQSSAPSLLPPPPTHLQPIQLKNEQEQYIKPKLGVDLKLQVLSLQKQRPPFERQHIQDTAEVLEEILLAVDQGLDRLPERQKIGASAKEEIKNKAKEDKEIKFKQDKDLEKQKEDLRKKRHQMLQEEIEKQKQEKLKQQEEQKEKLEAQEKEKKLKERRERSLMRQKLEQKRQQVEEIKKQKLDEKEAKQKEEEDKKNQEKLLRQKDHKEFFKKQKEQLEQEFQKRRQEQEEAEKIKKEMEEAKKMQQEHVKNKMVNFMKQNKDQLRNEQQEWSDIQQFYEDNEVQEMFQRYSKSFGIMFNQFAAMDKKEMSKHSMKRINLNEFSKFGFQTKIVPKVVTNDDLVLIFRAIIRERTSTMTQKEMDFLGVGVNTLGLEDFKKALIRISILGQQRLGDEESLENKLPLLLSQPDAKPQPSTRVPRNIRIRGRSNMHSGASNRQPLTKQNSEIDIQAQEEDQQQPENNTPSMAGPKRTSLARKTREQKILEELQKAKERQEKLSKIKIEDKKLNKAFDVSLINPRTLEALIQYIQLVPNKIGNDLSQNYIEEGATAEQENIEKEDDYNNLDQQQSQNFQDIQGNGGEPLEAVDPEELERQEDTNFDNIVGPNGEKENWKIAE